MSQSRNAHESQQWSWTWYVMPALAAVAALTTLFSPPRSGATEPIAIEAPHHAMLLAPSPQPGAGEPALAAQDLPQSY